MILVKGGVHGSADAADKPDIIDDAADELEIADNAADGLDVVNGVFRIFCVDFRNL